MSPFLLSLLALTGCGSRIGWTTRGGTADTSGTGWYSTGSTTGSTLKDCAGSVPLAGSDATVVLEADRCDCTLVAVGTALPGVVLRSVEGGGAAEAVRGWVLTGITGDPAPVIEGQLATGIAFDVAYVYSVAHPESGITSVFDAIIRPGSAEVVTQSFSGCP